MEVLGNGYIFDIVLNLLILFDTSTAIYRRPLAAD